MSHRRSLQVVLMRPRALAQQWMDRLVGAGMQVTILPMIDIIPISVRLPLIDAVSLAEDVIVTSQHSAICAPSSLIQGLISHCPRIMTMGASTTAALEARGVTVQWTAAVGSQSETLLREALLQQGAVANKRMAIIAGQGGRTLLADTLRSRGAHVDVVMVYRQQPIQYALDNWLEKWRINKSPLCWVASSGNILLNFISQIDNSYASYKPWIQSQPLLVISDRIEKQAKAWGFQRIVNTQGAEWERVRQGLQSIARI